MKLATLRRKNFHLKIKSFIKKSRVGASAKEKENRTCMNKCSKNFELIIAPLHYHLFLDFGEAAPILTTANLLFS